MNNTLFTSLNFIIFAVAVLVLATGYWCMGQGPITNPLSLSVAPFLLIIGYCAIIPMAILAVGKAKTEEKK